MVVLIVAGDRTTPAAQADCTSIVEQLQRVDWSDDAPRIHIVPDADTGRWLLRSITPIGDHVADDAIQPPAEESTAARAASKDSASWPLIERRRRSTDRRQCRLPEAGGADRRAGEHDIPSDASSQPLTGPTLCTEREQEIVRFRRRGRTNKQIAHRLGIVEDTVKKHLQHIYDKLGVRRRALVMLDRSDLGDPDGHAPVMP
jgi:DNA-binding CsgD family transcriptional regulator